MEDLEVCGPEELKMFCKDYVEIAEVSFILSTVDCLNVFFQNDNILKTN